MPPELFTERLRLCDFAEHDAAGLLAIFSDPLTVEFTEWEPFKTIADAEWLIEWARTAAGQDPRTVFAWAIHWRDAENTPLLGIATLTIRDLPLGQGDIGYILDRSVWGRGVATEAARALLDFAFRQLRLHRVTGSCCPENIGSVRVLEKIGMRREGCLVKNIREKGQWRDTVIFALLESEAISGC
ncbi:MAG: GNAT family N-acetyltransferase [Fibrella sp.]|nr:GNAT family N-acetyltransferase [Armatimonadota bacterium]